jgi:phage tail sheath protein FI
MCPDYQHPGVYVSEVNASPGSVVRAETAVPAFIGYTPVTEQNGKSCLCVPTLITSMADFLSTFGYPTNPKTKQTPPQYCPSYHLTRQTSKPTKGTSYTFNGDTYTIEADPNTIYYLYTSLQLFFKNGGKKAYIVSVGSYGAPSGKAMEPGAQMVNPNVLLSDLKKGLEALKEIPQVTKYVFPEATLLSPEDNSSLMQAALAQCGSMKTAMCLFDVIGGREPDPNQWTQDIENFRNATGNDSLQYGVAYYPNLKTTIIPLADVTYKNIDSGDTSQLETLLNPPSDPNPKAETILKKIKEGDPAQNSDALAKVSKTFQEIRSIVHGKMNIIPPSGAMAGIYSLVDESRGVWVAPANISPVGVTDVTLRIDDQQQGSLNVDPVSGKSINAIRYFTGQGVLVWGARTLDGNSQEWRYINVRRFITMIEQSAKLALRDFVFSPNTEDTWAMVRSSLTQFLTNIWSEGGLMGSTTDQAFNVQCGLNTTMTAQDVLDGKLKVTLFLAALRPAEFIVVSIEQQLAST